MIVLQFCSDCSIRVSRFLKQNVVSCSCSIFNKAAPFVLEYDFQPVITSFISIVLIMMIIMMIIGTSRS